MSVHYKFKSSLDFDTITFDGLHISVNDFRKAVIQQKRLGKTNDFELQITNAQTKEEYENDNDLIPKNTSLIISRIPQTSKKPRDSQNQNTPTVCPPPKLDSNTLDLSQMNASEEDKIQAMMAQSTVDYDPRGYQKIRGPGQTGEVPPSYRCYKCHQSGHWIKNCPLPHSGLKKPEIRRNTGIPKSFLQEKLAEKDSTTEEIVVIEKQTEIPDELVCSICKGIFRDAVMIPCCGSSFCDDCVRSALLESEENECPDCKEKGTSPDSLIPNRFLRSAVSNFKNETGYDKRKKNNGVHEAPTAVETTPEIVSEKEVEKKEEVIPKDVPEKSVSPVEESIANSPIETRDATPPPKSNSENEETPTVIKDDVEPKKPEEKKESENRESFTPERDSPKQVEVVVPTHEVQPHGVDIPQIPEDQFEQSSSSFPNYRPPVPDLPHRSNTTDSYPARGDGYMRHNKPNQGIVPPHMNYCNNYDNRPERTFSRFYYPRDSYNMNTAPYPYVANPRCRQMATHSNMQHFYPGIPGTMETGIIEDPLEAFNRIMKEKEKRKEMKRLATERHRSAGGRRGPRECSPMMEKRGRHRLSPINERRTRSPLRQEKQSSHRPIEREKALRSHRSHYPGNKRSFSRSNSPPQRKYSKSPRRRSRSRSRPRSISRETDLLRHHGRSFRFPSHQSHRSDYDKEMMRYNKKPSRFSEARSVNESGVKENRRHNSKTRENGNPSHDNYMMSSRKAFHETENIQDNREPHHEAYDRRRNRPEEPQKLERRPRDNNGDERYIIPPEDDHAKEENDKKSKDRKKKKEKEEKTEKKSKKDKKEKKKRERHKDEPKKHGDHKKIRKESSSTTNHTSKEEDDENRSQVVNKKDYLSPIAEFADDKAETFTPDININRNVETDSMFENKVLENRPKIKEEIHNPFKTRRSPILSRSEGYNKNVDKFLSGLSSPTSFIATTPENYPGKWDRLDFGVPNSNEHDSHMMRNSSPPLKNDPLKGNLHVHRRRDSMNRVYHLEDRRSRNDENYREKRSEFPRKGSSTKRLSPSPSGRATSSSNNSNSGKRSPSKKRRKKSKHKKDSKRSPSADSSKHSRKSSSKHKKSKSEKKKKIKRTDSR